MFHTSAFCTQLSHILDKILSEKAFRTCKKVIVPSQTQNHFLQTFYDHQDSHELWHVLAKCSYILLSLFQVLCGHFWEYCSYLRSTTNLIWNVSSVFFAKDIFASSSERLKRIPFCFSRILQLSINEKDMTPHFCYLIVERRSTDHYYNVFLICNDRMGCNIKNYSLLSIYKTSLISCFFIFVRGDNIRFLDIISLVAKHIRFL